MSASSLLTAGPHSGTTFDIIAVQYGAPGLLLEQPDTEPLVRLEEKDAELEGVRRPTASRPGPWARKKPRTASQGRPAFQSR
ncbi:hypothetical protein [Streptomyces canus]|uniref:Uncharacterized protein n=1 Tax=Streptomyces canus TaxID=58343 RepID=A0AAW8F4Z4_9ACTN|nr:hypothetical protein [Streptomyces canus]MDQ1064822.1 hypothetical protein [Streptomyces canus]